MGCGHNGQKIIGLEGRAAHQAASRQMHRPPRASTEQACLRAQAKRRDLAALAAGNAEASSALAPKLFREVLGYDDYDKRAKPYVL